MELTFSPTMRGEDKKQSLMLMLMSPETGVPTEHPLRAIKKMADEALAKLSPIFDRMYAQGGRPSVPPDQVGSLEAPLLRGDRHRARPDRRAREGEEGKARAEQIRAALKMESKEMPRVLKEGLAKKKLKAKGQKRATTYTAA